MDIKQEHHALLSGEDKQEFEIWEELLNHRGYALLHEFLSGHNDSCAAVIQNPGTWDNHNYARGYRDALALVLNLEAILEAKVVQIAEDILEAQSDEDELDEISVNLDLS